MPNDSGPERRTTPIPPRPAGVATATIVSSRFTAATNKIVAVSACDFHKENGLLSVTDELIQANQNFASHFDFGSLAVQPRRKLAILACMDSRILFEMCMGVKLGDAHMIRNAGGIATEDAIRSLIVSHHLLDTQEFIIINHTDCGLLRVREDELKNRLVEKMGTQSDSPSRFYAFDDLEENVRQQVRTIKSHPWIPKQIPVRGFIYDVKTGRLTEIKGS